MISSFWHVPVDAVVDQNFGIVVPWLKSMRTLHPSGDWKPIYGGRRVWIVPRVRHHVLAFDHVGSSQWNADVMDAAN